MVVARGPRLSNEKRSSEVARCFPDTPRHVSTGASDRDAKKKKQQYCKLIRFAHFRCAQYYASDI